MGRADQLDSETGPGCTRPTGCCAGTGLLDASRALGVSAGAGVSQGQRLSDESVGPLYSELFGRPVHLQDGTLINWLTAKRDDIAWTNTAWDNIAWDKIAWDNIGFD